MSTSTHGIEIRKFGDFFASSNILSSIDIANEQEDLLPEVIFHFPRDTGTSNSYVITIADYQRTETSTKIDSVKAASLIEAINTYSELTEDWDGYSGVSPSPEGIADAIKLLKQFPENLLPSRAGISSDGELCFIWEKDDLFADFGLYGDGGYCFYIERGDSKLYGDDIDITESIPHEAIKLLGGFSTVEYVKY